jgi:hypothetical protein
VRTPDPAVIVRTYPVAVGVKIFRAHDILIEILNVIFESLREVLLTLIHPVVDDVALRCGKQVPIAGIVAGDDEFSGTVVAQSKT